MVYCYEINKLSWMRIIFPTLPLPPRFVRDCKMNSFIAMKQEKIGKCSPIYILFKKRKK